MARAPRQHRLLDGPHVCVPRCRGLLVARGTRVDGIRSNATPSTLIDFGAENVTSRNDTADRAD